MAASLRHPLSGLVWLAMAVIYLPILPAGVMLFAPALSATNWQRLLNDPQLPQATVATLISTLIATLGALLIALFFVCLLWPGQRWRRLTTRLPWLLAIPHVAFATSALLLFAEGGLFYQLCTFCTAPFDRYGVGLGLTLAVKESAFVLWAIYALLPEQRLAQQKIVLQTFGYGRYQTLSWLILPAIAPVLGAVMLAVLAWSLSVVDMAIVLGPSNPPTLAVLAWQWLSQGDAQQQAKGMLQCLLLLMLLAALAALGYGLWRVWRRTIPELAGTRRRSQRALPERALSGLLPACGILCAAVLLMLAQGGDVGSVGTSLSFGLLSSLIALIVIFLWLEWGPQRGAAGAASLFSPAGRWDYCWSRARCSVLPP
ncbi:inner membrane ABC transporter permease protein YnjC [Enterobacter cloacae]|nr:Inner membrane ABC transporter permease protein YnjC [Enterobacter cloacae]CAE7807246.1 Inner membrane ABC transporter permease protein YnjC [Enterobacter cloacae]CAH3659599.1 Inner membrane ABC transporter permease protein YnjC [Enterobacter cloacae]CAH3960770.1 Inner membrane ABC transporter permease protein YnjC [Enterobacter cloacae]SAE39318.1 inner membrane ABC transporter permease protein YnjC [Enterobacter cloacae]